MDKRNIPRGLQSPGLLGRKPIIGLSMFIIGSLIFVILAYNVVNQGPLLKWDLPIAESFHNFALQSSSFVTNIMISGYYIGNWGVVIVGLLLSLYFLHKRFWRELVMTVVSLGLSGIIFLILSHIFNRTRPSLLFAEKIWAGNLTIAGFPSGHAKTVLVCCGFLVYLFLPKIKSYLGKVLVILVALLVVLFVGFSRLYVGDHYLTDVIAGYAVGIAWFGLAYTSIELLFKPRNSTRHNNRGLNHSRNSKVLKNQGGS